MRLSWEGYAVLGLVAAMVSFLIAFASHPVVDMTTLEAQLETERGDWEAEVLRLEAEVEHLEAEYERLERQVEGWEESLDGWTFKRMEITAYAPLCSGAVPGWDYCAASGPGVTASGESFAPWHTAAAGPELPFGTRVKVQGVGEFRVADRGGLIGNGQLDIGVGTKSEARAWGRQSRLVAIKY